MKDVPTRHTRNLKRDKLLSEKERERLLDRNDKSMAAINDVRVRKKLSNWLKTLDEISLIFNHLPEEQSRNVVTYENILEILCLAARAMKIGEFYPICGDVDDPSTWEADFDRCKPINFEKCNAELYRAKFGNFIVPSRGGLGKFDKQIIAILQTGVEMDINGLLKGLRIDPSDSEAVATVRRQIEILCAVGFAENTAKGWRWTTPPESKQKKS
jgi:hypothetical protein